MTDEVLSLEPIDRPAYRPHPSGVQYGFAELVADAGMKNVVSGNQLPEIRVYAGDRDYVVPYPGRAVYCVAGANLPLGKRERAREILRRLAYGYLDWAAREVVGRYHRDLKRATEQIFAPVKGSPASVRIRRYLRANPGAGVTEIAEATGVAQPNVSRTLAGWQEEGRVRLERNGRNVRCYLEDAPECSLLKR